MRVAFQPLQAMVDLVEKIAADPTDPNHSAAAAAMEQLKDSIAPEAAVAAVKTTDDLEVDDQGVFMSKGEDGVWVQSWAWVPSSLVPELYPEDDPENDLEGPTP